MTAPQEFLRSLSFCESMLSTMRLSHRACLRSMSCSESDEFSARIFKHHFHIVDERRFRNRKAILHCAPYVNSFPRLVRLMILGAAISFDGSYWLQKAMQRSDDSWFSQHFRSHRFFTIFPEKERRYSGRPGGGGRLLVTHDKHRRR